MKFKHLLICLFLFSGVSMNAQDIHFSQFYLSPLNLNPAMAGVMNCNIRLVANYRNQWASVLKSNAYSTYSASYDQKIAVGRYDYFGVGATFWGDVAGEANFATTTGKLSGSYSKRMGGSRKEAHYLVLGAEVGLSQRSINFDKLRWGTQHDGQGGHNPLAPSLEDNLTNNQFLFGDIAAGLLWFSVFDESNNLYIGGAYHHLNRANQTFYEKNGLREDLYSRFTIHAGGEFAVASRLGLLPGVIVMKQGPSFEVNSGTSLRFNLGGGRPGSGNFQAFQFGTWVRVSNKVDSGILTDAVILSTRFDYNQFSVGFSYDLNVSALQPASNSNGAFEFALLYKFCGTERRGVYCPNF
ncbi:MAG TPA: type IX secretion system membrane protein PorP/SprF [Bacteroidetes bacterium]|nr:type IX secretion system membrane protein PorP/SprF [Bacteroidota bacterium]